MSLVNKWRDVLSTQVSDSDSWTRSDEKLLKNVRKHRFVAVQSQLTKHKDIDPTKIDAVTGQTASVSLHTVTS